MSRWSVLIVAGCLLTACGGDDDVASTNAVATTEAAGTTAVASTAVVTTESTSTAAATTEATTATTKSPDGTTPQYPERFDAKHVTVTPDGTDGLRIREVVDVDFGSTDRHGYQRFIPDDFGTPADITAASPDAPGRFEVVVTGLDLQDPSCDVGSSGTSGGCTLERDGDVFRAVISPLEVGHGITIGGTISARTEPVDVPEPAIPPRR